MRRSALLLALLLPVGVVAQTQPKVSVTAQGSFRSAPDAAEVYLQVQGQNPDLKTAYAEAQSQAEQVRALLRAHGFTPQEAHWSGYQVQPNMDYRSHRVTSYSVHNDVQLEITDFAKIGPLLDDASGKGLNALRSVSFALKHMQAAKAAAIADGYGKAHAEAEALAKAAGLRLGSLATATVDTSGGASVPLPRMMAMSAAEAGAPAPSAGFSPQEITVSASITAVYRLEPGH
ncbi:MAG: SIMPL domain-containing protein [Terriglobales bacterium]